MEADRICVLHSLEKNGKVDENVSITSMSCGGCIARVLVTVSGSRFRLARFYLPPTVKSAIIDFGDHTKNRRRKIIVFENSAFWGEGKELDWHKAHT